ncbi:MAG: hypothetical protein EOM55_03830 [Clostridia bacterium]|nr:hypothetical protein [Clostridia bacterium]
MTESIEQFFLSIFGGNVVLATILISIIPIIELKGAIPFSMSVDIWGANALSIWEAFAYAVLGTSLIIFLLALIYIPLIKWLKSTKFFKKLGEKLENLINRKKQVVEDEIAKEKSKKKILWLKIAGVFLFVANPIPFTGVWTGTCLAIALGLNYWTACATVVSGNIVAGLLILLLSHFFGGSTLILFYILLGIAVLIAIYMILKSIVKKQKQKKSLEDSCLKNDKKYK